MKCLYCQSDLDEKTTDFSLKVMLCKQCAVGVSKLRARLQSELEVVLASLDDTLRFAVLARDLPGGFDREMSRGAILRFIVDMDEICRRQTQSSKSTRPNAITAVGSDASDKLSVQD